MPNFICCGFRRNHSPDQSPARLIDISEKGGRSQLTASNTGDTQRHGAENLDDTSSVDTLDPNQDVLPFELPQQMKHRRDRGPMCLGVTERLKKKISSASGASDEASTRALKSTMSIEEVEAKRKIRRALHSRNEADADENVNSEFYDPDAVVIRTPQGTWPRQEGTIRLSPHRIKRITAGSSSPDVQTSDFEGPPLAHPSPTRANTRILSRMLTDRASALSEPPIEEQKQPMQQGFIKSPRKTKSKKYIFSDETPGKEQSPPDSSLERSDTVIRITPTRQPDTRNAADEDDVFKAPPTPDIKALRLASISDSIVGPGWRLPSSARRDSSQTFETAREHDPSPDLNTVFATARQSQASPSRPPWMRGASGLIASPPYGRRASRHHSHCDPGSEEEVFGGLDGRDSFPQTRSHSATTNPSSVHLYSMHISERLASHGLLPALSSPHLRTHSSSELSWKKGPECLSLGPRRQVSDHGFASARRPPVWGNPQKQGASSIYSRRTSELSTIDPGSQAASLSNRHSRLSSDRECSGPVGPQGSQRLSGEANNAAAAILDPNSNQGHGLFRVMRDPMIIDEREVEKQPRHFSAPANPTSPSRSLTTSQIEQEEGQRFLRKAHTVTATRYFSEADLDELTAEIGKRTPARSRNVSRFDGSSDVSNSLLVPPTESSLARKPSLVVGDEPVEATSWGQALQNDARRRSRSPLHIHHPAEDDEGSHKHRSPKQLFQHLHHSSSEGDHLDVKAQLGAYRMLPRLSPLVPGHPAITTPAKIRRNPDTSSPTPSMETAPSWRQYPSHTRSARSDSSASEADNVFSRDFASAPIPPHDHHRHPHLHFHHDPADQHHLHRPGLAVTKKAHSTHFERLKDNVRELYHARSLDLASKFAIESRGHRSSISEGRGLEEYPELEMLPPLVVGGGDGANCGEKFVTAKTSMGDQVGKTREILGDNGGGGRKLRVKAKVAGPTTSNTTRPGKKRRSVDRLIAGSGRGKVRSMAHAIDAPSAGSGAAASKTKTKPGWGTMYDSCVDLGMLRSPNLSREGVVASNGGGCLIGGLAERMGDVRPMGSSDGGRGEGMRQSTLDFKRSLEEGERRSWERLRRLGDRGGSRLRTLEI